jgi:hypothetical protein
MYILHAAGYQLSSLARLLISLEYEYLLHTRHDLFLRLEVKALILFGPSLDQGCVEADQSLMGL